MTTALEPLSGGFHSNERHVTIVEKRRKNAHRVGAAADARHHGARQLAPPLQRLGPCFPADDRLEIAHDPREWVGPYHRPDDVMRGGDIGDPIAQRITSSGRW